MRSAGGGHLTQISGINGSISLFDGKLDPVLELVSLEAGSSTLWRDNEISRYSHGSAMAGGTNRSLLSQ